MVIDKQLEEYLKIHDFISVRYLDNNHALRKEIYNGCYLYVEIGEYDSYIDKHGISVDFIFKNKEFESVLYVFYKNYCSLANQYSPKASVEDLKNFDLISFACVSSRFSTKISSEFSQSFDWALFSSALVKIHLFELIVNLQLISNDENLFDMMFRNKFGEFFIMNDTSWLFIYLAIKMGWTVEKIEKEFKKVYMYWHKKNGNLHKEIDCDIIKCFYDAYESIAEA